MRFSQEQRLWREILQKFVSMKCLWCRGESQKSMAECDAAWDELVDMAKQKFGAVDKDFVQRRIRGFRVVCTRERRKIIAAEKVGKRYQPKIFYYDILKAIYKDEKTNTGIISRVADTISNSDSKAETFRDETDNGGNSSHEEAEEDDINPEPEPPTTRIRQNPAAILARRMAEHLERMDADQALIAEKIISDICVYGRLNQLNIHSSIVLK